MLLLPCHIIKPTSIPFRVTHLILACTRSVVTANTGLKIGAPAANITRTPEEKIAMARNVVKSLLDPTWIEENSEPFERLFKRTMNPKMWALLFLFLISENVLLNFIRFVSSRPSEIIGLIITFLFYTRNLKLKLFFFRPAKQGLAVCVFHFIKSKFSVPHRYS